jgi:hypothetical protein
MNRGESMHHHIQTREKRMFSDFLGPLATEITARVIPITRVRKGGIIKIESLLSISFTS